MTAAAAENEIENKTDDDYIHLGGYDAKAYDVW